MGLARFLGAVCILLALSTAGWALNCGDASGNGFVTMGDVVYMMEYMFAGGPPPLDFIEADYDDYELLTIRDATLLASSDWTCDVIIPLCPPDEPPIEPVYDNRYKIYFTDHLPANQSNLALNLTLRTAEEYSEDAIYGMCLPLEILVDGTIPAIDSIEFPLSGSEFHGLYSRYLVYEDAGIVLLGAMCRLWEGTLGVDRFATIYISVPPQPVEREVKVIWHTLSPTQVPEPDTSLYPMLVGYCGWPVVRPELVPNCCVTAGDANNDGIANIADAVFLIQCIFVECPPMCLEQADANGDELSNITDVVYIINFIFGGGPAPVCGVFDY